MGQNDTWRDVQSPEDRIEMLEVQIRRRDHALDVQEGKLRELEAERDRLAAALRNARPWLLRDSPGVRIVDDALGDDPS